MTKALTKLKERRDELVSRIEALDTESIPIRQQLGNLDRQRDKLKGELHKVKADIDELSQSPRVSDHAVIRYLERKHGFPFESVRSELLTDAVLHAMDAGAGAVRMNGGTLRIKGRTVVTYIED